MSESSTIHLPTACPKWCVLREPDKLHQHEAGVLTTGGRLQVYVDHEPGGFRVNANASILVNVAYYDDGHHETAIDIDAVVDAVSTVEDLRQLAAAASAAATFVEALEDRSAEQ